MSYVAIHEKLLQAAQDAPPAKGIFFKTGKGDYAEHDIFIGIKVPVLRVLAKEYKALKREELAQLLHSAINEERLLALFILVGQYDKAQLAVKEELYSFYLEHKAHVNNWNLVDSSAHLIVGRHLLHAEKTVLLELARSSVVWDRRIAMVATWYFIRNNQFDWTITLAEQLLCDEHDLMHKAVGWMLREAGEKDQAVLIAFLDRHAAYMPRTMLRYAIEKFPEHERKAYLHKKIESI